MTTRYKVVTFTLGDGTFESDNNDIMGDTAEAAIEAWKEDACEQAELSFGDDEEAVDRNQQEIYDMKSDLLEGRVTHSEYFGNLAALVEINESINQVGVLCFDIDWDREVDGETFSGHIPEVLVIHTVLNPEDGSIDEDALSDALSDATGFCHRGFKSQVL